MKIKVAATQMTCDWEIENNIKKSIHLIEKADRNAQNIIQSIFPKRKVIAINGIDISLGGGNIHCITQQQPLSIHQ